MAPIDPIDRTHLLDEYVAHAKAVRHGVNDDPHYWAVEAIDELIRRDPDEAWTLLLELIARAEDDRMLASIAAGPLENLIVRHGWHLIEKIEAEAETGRRFRRALSGVWGETQMSEDLAQRIKLLVRDEPPF